MRYTTQYNICEGDSVQIGNKWFKEAGVYNLTEIKAGCTEINTVILNVNAPINQALNVNLCKGDTIMLFNQSIFKAGEYTLRKTVPNACDSVYNISVNEYPVLNLDYQIKLPCPKDNSGVINIINVDHEKTFDLYFNGILTSQRTFTQLAKELYSFTVIDSNNCVTDTSIALSEQYPPKIEFLISTPNCVDDPTGSIYVTDENYYISLYENFHGSERKIDSLESGIYRVYFKEKDGCLWDTSLTIDEAIPPSLFLPSQVVVVSGSSYKIVPVHNMTNPVFHWSPSEGLSCTDCPSPMAQPIKSTEYYVTITDEKGCKAVGRILILIESAFYYPSVIKPNSQNGNNIFVIRSSEDIGIIELRIFDRWGNMVFSQENILSNHEQGGWDGRFKGSPLESGVYVGYLKYLNFSGVEVVQTFNITLLD